MKTSLKKINQKVRINSSFKALTIFFSFFLIAVVFVMFGFITYQALDLPQEGAIDIIDILFSTSINVNEGKYSFWLPFSVTIITSLLALMIAAPLGVKTAVFIKFRMPKKYQKATRLLFDILAGIPSVVFGLFAITGLGGLFSSLFNISPYTIFTSIFMLTFMIIPTVISLTINNLDSISKNLITNPMAIGTTRTRSIYKIYLKAARPGIIVACVLAFTRAIAESIALSMLLAAIPSTNMFASFDAFFLGNHQTIGAFLATQMFAESNIDVVRPALFTFGLILFIISIIINGILVSIQRKKQKKFKKLAWFENKLVEIIYFLPDLTLKVVESLTYRSKKGYKISHHDVDQSVMYAKERIDRNYWATTYSVYKISWEVISFTITAAFVIWISLDILVKGSVASTQPNTILSYGKEDIGQSFVNTILVVFVAIAFSMPIALLVAIYLNEYAKNGKFKKTTLFFADAIGTTPSILFGMFGLLFFVETFGFGADVKGKSLIAGALTLSLVVIPTFVRFLQQALANVPMELRWNSMALGNTKFSTIRRLVLPTASAGIVTALVLTMGRIMSETAPLYLTAGLSSANSSSLEKPGMTLTTHIYKQVFSSDTSIERSNIQYQATLLIFVIIFSLVFIGYIVVPNWKNIKYHIKEFFMNFYAKNLHKRTQRKIRA